MIHAVRSANRCAIAVFGTRTRSFPAARKIGAGRYGDALQRDKNRRAGTLMNVNMTDWSESQLAELGPMLRGYIEASFPRKRDAQHSACTNCGDKFGNHPGRRSRFCPACRPQDRLRAAREGMRRRRSKES